MKCSFSRIQRDSLQGIYFVLRDPMTLFFMFFPPLVEMIAFGFALDNDVKHMATVVLNEDGPSRAGTIDRFVNTETFRVVGEAQSLDANVERNAQGQSVRRHCRSRRIYPRLQSGTPRKSRYWSTARIPPPRCRRSTPHWVSR